MQIEQTVPLLFKSVFMKRENKGKFILKLKNDVRLPTNRHGDVH